MTTAPTEINAAAVKNSGTDKYTPMMYGSMSPCKVAGFLEPYAKRYVRRTDFLRQSR
jgi:hypothetical protein